MNCYALQRDSNSSRLIHLKYGTSQSYRNTSSTVSSVRRWHSVSTTAPPSRKPCVRRHLLLYLPLADISVGAVSDDGRTGVWGRHSIPGYSVPQEQWPESGFETVSRIVAVVTNGMEMCCLKKRNEAHLKMVLMWKTRSTI